MVLLGLCAFLAAFLLQAAWESPLRPLIFWITDPGCRFGWYIATPDYSSNGSVLRFDLIASVVNAIVYFIFLFAGALILKRVRR